MPEQDTMETEVNPRERKALLGLDRRRRFKIYRWSVVLLLVGAAGWVLWYLRPERWYSYTDQVAFEQVARDVKPGFVLWQKAEPAGEGIERNDAIGQPAISSDGTRMVYVAGGTAGDANLFLRRWDGTKWGEPRPMRALNSSFHETAPALSGDGHFLFFSSDRPGGRGGQDIWVARWDGVEYAWPLPLTDRVNTAFDEIDPAFSPDGLVLYFASNRPLAKPGQSAPNTEGLTRNEINALQADFDLYSADIAGDTPFDLVVERQLSMLYSLRQGALADPKVMAKLGGSQASEAAVDKALAYLASKQSEDGRWDLGANGGKAGHEVSATAFALLAYYGRGERHDIDCRYRDTVARGLKWLISQQNAATGDLRGPKPQSNGMYDHGIGSLALIEAYGVTKDLELRPKALAAIDFIVEAQHEEGGWRYKPGDPGDLSVSGWMVMALASAEMSGLPVPEKTRKGVVRFLDAMSGGQHGGTYGYDKPPGKGGSKSIAMQAVGFFCSQLTGASANAAKAFESALSLDKSGFQVSDLYTAYYGTLAAYQHQGPVWRKWMANMHKTFIETQAGDGSWTASGPHASAMGPLIGTALVTLCLEAHYRYTPLYGLGYEPDPKGPSEGVANLASLPAEPHFRHAKYLEVLSSRADDRGPVVTEHGDFLYFASSRPGGFGGSDIYRTRISGEEPTAPKNLGPEINSTANESDPAVRMAGFHLLVNSDRDGNGHSLFSAKSRRVERKHDYAKMPGGDWLVANIGWLIGLFAALVLFAWLCLRALRAGRLPLDGAEKSEPFTGGAAA
jgi:hypothetical protein